MSIVSARAPQQRTELRAAGPAPVTEPAKTRGVTSRAILNVLEAFFRRPLLHLLPLIVLAALGAYLGLTIQNQYQSVGVLNATSGDLLSDLTTAGTRSFGYETPAVVTSRTINDLLSTERFLDDVIDNAQIRGSVESGAISRGGLRGAVGAHARGDNLVILTATTPSRELSPALAQAVSDSFIDYVVTNDLGDQQIRVDTYAGQLEEYTSRLTEATDAYEAYMRDHPIADEDDRPFVEQLEIERLQADLQRATDSFLEAQANLDEANLSANVARTVVARQLSVVDVPSDPVAPLPHKREAAKTFLMFAMLGAVLSVGFVVARALLDRSLRTPDDVETRFGMDVLAVVPKSSR